MQLLVRVVVGSSRRGGNDSGDFVSRLFAIYTYLHTKWTQRNIYEPAATKLLKKQGEQAYP
jgi:hypothetical protein